MRSATVGRALSVLAVAGIVAACDRADMVAQPKSANWDRDTAFADGSSMRQPVPGTEPRDEPNLPVAQPPAITQVLLERGQQRFDIFCSPCHGRSGDGQGMIVQRGFPAPPHLWTDKLVAAKAAYLYDVITNGHGVMYSYADRVPPADRWAIIAYVRALQVSQSVDPARLSTEDRRQLEADR